MPNKIHSTVKIGEFSSIEQSVKGSIFSIDENSVIDDFVKIKFTGGLGDIIVGKNVFINSGSVFYSGNGIRIGDYVLIGPNCSFVPTNHEFRNKGRLIKNQGFSESKGGIIVESDVWIGANVTILDGSYIKKGAVIGANSLVNGEIDEFSINIGVPSKCVGYRK